MSKPKKMSDRLDKAARAGWLYYVAGNSQDEIARKMGISRQSAQRLVSMAVSENLIKFKLDHPIADCMELATRLTSKFGLLTCQVVPVDPEAPELITGVAIAGALELRKQLETEIPKVIAMGTGLLPRACVEQLAPMNCPQHHIVSMVGNMHQDGSATPYSVVERMADLVGSPYNPMPLPVLVENAAELSILNKQGHVERTLQLCERADATFVGLAHIDDTSPLVRDGFISAEESKELVRLGAVGEIVGWVYDRDGQLISSSTNDRVSSAPLKPNNANPVVGLAVGIEKADAILGALGGKLINGLVIDETIAKALLTSES
tara:strand:+ start:971 stop:1930 length:960 start_codon:yes stop_codon:yes gene_type:complete